MEEDKKLYKEFLNGNEEAFNKLINKYKNNIIYFITRYVKHKEIAEDIFQDVIMYILENKEKYNPKYSLKTYFYTIAKSKSLNYLKKNKKQERLEDTYKDEKLVEDIIFSNERKEKIIKVINNMPRDYQIVIYLTKIEGLSYKETGKIMEKTPSQIKTLAHNSKKKLKELLVKEKIIEVNKNKIIRLLLVIFTSIIVMSGIVYSGVTIYKKYIWKKPEKFNYNEEKEVTSEDRKSALDEEEAKNIAIEITKKLKNSEEVTIKNAELIKYPDDKEMEWFIQTNEQISVNLDAYTGKLISYSDNSIDDTKIASTMNKEDIERTIKDMYQNLGYSDEYTLTNLQKYAVTDDTNLWQGDFCKVYDGIANEYECIRLTIIPEIKHLWGVNIFNTKTENNPIEISKDEAIEIAKAKSISLGKDENNIKNITAELKFEKMNTFVYSQEVYEESINSISNNVSNNNDNITNIQSTDNTYGYRTENLVRKVWRVEIEYNNDLFKDLEAYFVDCTTGEILGGDAIK